MTPTDWSIILGPQVEWPDAYAAVEREARAWLTRQDEFSDYTTTELVEALYPEQFARGDGIKLRKRMFKALAALALHDLADCCTKGTPRRLKHSKKMVTPWNWHSPREPAPPAPKLCPHCGKELP